MEGLKPYLVSFSLTSRCPLSCPHCFTDAGREGYDMPMEEVRRVLRDLRDLSPFSMVILTGGEPLLRDDLEEIVSLSSGLGFVTVLATTGLGFSRERLERLKEAGLKGVSVSLDSADPEFHDGFRGVKGSWERAVEVLKACAEAGVDAQINTTLTDQNVDQIERIRDLALELGVRVLNFFFIVCTGRAARSFISVENYGKALRKIGELSVKERRIMVRPRCAPHVYRFFPDHGLPVGGGTRGCPAGRFYLRIDERGRVYPCPYTPLAVGDLRRESLSWIWESSEVLKKLRSEDYSGRCGVCKFRVLCGGCRARALTESGDLMGEDPLCDYRPSGTEEPIRYEVNAGEGFELVWSEEAKERIRRVPLFLRSIVVKLVERMAKEEGVREITPEFLEKVRRSRGG
jgi:radical SAM protein with 4Fe4S-binding SPASM domain